MSIRQTNQNIYECLTSQLESNVQSFFCRQENVRNGNTQIGTIFLNKTQAWGKRKKRFRRKTVRKVKHCMEDLKGQSSESVLAKMLELMQKL